MKHKIEDAKKFNSLQAYPKYCAYEADHLVSTNADWRSVRPVINLDKCVGCNQCYMYCPDGAIVKQAKKVAVDYDFCKGCGICKRICKTAAIEMEVEEK